MNKCLVLRTLLSVNLCRRRSINIPLPTPPSVSPDIERRSGRLNYKATKEKDENMKLYLIYENIVYKIPIGQFVKGIHRCS